MATILLVFIYIFYIGLGIPDSLLGAAWPAIYGDLSVPISYASLVSVIISCGTVLSSLFSAHVIAKLLPQPLKLRIGQRIAIPV